MDEAKIQRIIRENYRLKKQLDGLIEAAGRAIDCWTKYGPCSARHETVRGIQQAIDDAKKVQSLTVAKPDSDSTGEG